MKKIFVIQQKMIGDVLVSSILCNNLKKAYPGAEIHYMVYSFTTPVVAGNPNIDNLVLFTENHRKSRWAFFKLIGQIRREKYDVIIDAYSKLESWITVFFSGAKRKISYKKSGRSFLYTDTVALIKKPTGSNFGLTIERRLSLLGPLHLNIKLDPEPKLFLTAQERKNAEKLFQKNGLDSSKKTIMLSILGSSEIKTYPLRYMSAVVDFIADNSGADLLFNYLPAHMAEAKIIYDNCKPSTKDKIFFDFTAGSLREFITVMNHCDMIIGNDGGPINMAKALGKPSFIIFSPWIEKEVWATFEDGRFHKSVHLAEYYPRLFKGKTEKELKARSLNLYRHFKPELIYGELRQFLDYNLTEQEESPQLKIEHYAAQNPDKQKISALVITLNEADAIGKTLENLSFADEIIVVDAFSEDGTVETVNSFSNVKLIQHEFLNFSDQRNFAIEQASHDWILFIDADEWIDQDLRQEIITTVKNPNDKVAFAIPRQFYFKDEVLRYSGFQTDKTIRLFHKAHAKYDPEKFVHETLLIEGNTGTLRNKLHHFSYQNHADYQEKMKRYAQLRARELFAKGLKPTAYHCHIKPAYRFLYHYIIRWGFLDGKKGYTLAKLNAYGVRQRYVELKKMYAKLS